MEHLTTIPVRGYHLDGYGHVNNARYLEFLEEARWAMVERSPAFQQIVAAGLGFGVVNININFRRGATVGDELRIATFLRSVGERSATLHQRIERGRDAEPVADADVTFVLFDRKGGVGEGRSVVLTPEMKRSLVESLPPAPPTGSDG